MGDDIHDTITVNELILSKLKSDGGGAGNIICSSSLQLSGGRNIQCSATTGTKVATSTTQKLGFWGATPVIQEDVTAAGISAATLLTALDKIGILNSV